MLTQLGFYWYSILHNFHGVLTEMLIYEAIMVPGLKHDTLQNRMSCGA